jgi:hypothetical protein
MSDESWDIYVGLQIPRSYCYPNQKISLTSKPVTAAERASELILALEGKKIV